MAEVVDVLLNLTMFVYIGVTVVCAVFPEVLGFYRVLNTNDTLFTLI